MPNRSSPQADTSYSQYASRYRYDNRPEISRLQIVVGIISIVIDGICGILIAEFWCENRVWGGIFVFVVAVSIGSGGLTYMILG